MLPQINCALAQVGEERTADLQVREGVIEIRAIRRNRPEGWAGQTVRLAVQGVDTQSWPGAANKGDHNPVW